MVRLLMALVCAASVLCGQSGLDRSMAALLGFETGSAGGAPGGWGGGPAGTLFVDEAVVHGGLHSLRIERAAASSGSFSSATLAIPIDFGGKTIEKWRT